MLNLARVVMVWSLMTGEMPKPDGGVGVPGMRADRGRRGTAGARDPTRPARGRPGGIGGLGASWPEGAVGPPGDGLVQSVAGDLEETAEAGEASPLARVGRAETAEGEAGPEEAEVGLLAERGPGAQLIGRGGRSNPWGELAVGEAGRQVMRR